MSAERVPEVLLVGTADWDQAIATNQHYMARELAQSFPVCFVESMGLRSPEFKIRDLRRILRRLRLGGFRSRAERRPVPAGVRVLSPTVLPRHVGLAERFNGPRVRRLVSAWSGADAAKVLWTYTPVTYEVEDEAAACVYHCVDLLGEVDGVPNGLVEHHERRLAAKGATAVGSSPVVVEHLERQGFSEVLYWPNVADVGVVRDARPVDCRGRRRAAVFAGNLTTKKVDFDLLREVMDEGLTLHLAGPIAEGGGDARRLVETLVARGAVYHGLLQPRELATLYWNCTVGLIPYAMNEYTRGVSPLKTYEYLAAGLAVVSTPVPAVEAMPGSVVVAQRGQFAASATSLGGVPEAADVDARLVVAAAHDWTARGRQARALIDSLLGAAAKA